MLLLINILGWVGTAMILLGAYLNAKGRSALAMAIWIIGDLIWIVYDVYINNFSHMTLSLIIIIINSYGIHRIWKKKRQVK